MAKAINRALKEHMQAGNAVPKVFAAKVISNIADACADNNPNFNRTIFYRACVKDLAEGTLLDDDKARLYKVMYGGK